MTHLKRSQFASAKRLLNEAFKLLGDARSIFANAGDADTAQRLRTIGEAVQMEYRLLDGELPSEDG